MDNNNYYDILHINPQSTEEEVRSAYKRLALQLHPDHSGHPQATLQMQLLNEAYAVLSNPEKRARYDREKSASTALAVVAKPANGEQRTEVHPAKKKTADPQLDRWLLDQLKGILRVIGFTIILFFWSLATGQVNLIVVFLFVVLAVYIVLSMIIRLRNLAG